MGNVKLKDIAEALNVSTVTVSNALAGRKGVSEEVRTQVVEKAKEMGYDLKKYSNKSQGFTIGVIVAEKYLELGVSFYWSMYQKVAYAASKSQSVTMLETLERENEEKGTVESSAGLLLIQHHLLTTNIPTIFSVGIHGIDYFIV